MKISDKKKLLTNKNSYMSIISYSCIDNSYGLFDYHSSSNSENKIYGLGSFHVNFEGDNAAYKRNLSGEGRNPNGNFQVLEWFNHFMK